MRHTESSRPPAGMSPEWRDSGLQPAGSQPSESKSGTLRSSGRSSPSSSTISPVTVSTATGARWVRIAGDGRAVTCIAVDGSPLLRALIGDQRELAICLLRGDGDTADVLGIAEDDVAGRIESLFHQLAISCREDLIARVVEQQIARCLGAASSVSASG